MSESRDELLYMSRTYRQSTISELTGIPQSTLSYVLRGERELPGKYQDATHYQYAQTAYDNLVYSGANETTAIINSGMPPSVVEDMEYRWQALIYNKTMFTIMRDWNKQGIDYTPDDVAREIPNRMQKTIDGYHKLQVSLQDAENNVWYTPKTEI